MKHFIELLATVGAGIGSLLTLTGTALAPFLKRGSNEPVDSATTITPVAPSNTVSTPPPSPQPVAEIEVRPGVSFSTETPAEKKEASCPTANGTVIDLFKWQVAQQPRNQAVAEGRNHLTFEALDRLSNRVAHALLKAGLRPEEIVAVTLDRSTAYVVTLLGVLKAGGSYLPIDPSIPADSLATLLADSETRFTVTTRTAGTRFEQWAGTVFAIDATGELDGESDESAVTAPTDPRRRAYVIYTSGSTGQPKGVEIEHSSLTNLVRCFFQESLGVTHQDRTTLLANVAFDASVMELWPCLCAGGTVCIVPQPLLTDLDGLIQWLSTEKITYAFIPTALAEIVLKRPWPAKMALRYLLTGGDTLHSRPPQGLPFQLINAYGPTENTVVSTFTIVSPLGENRCPPIGHPVNHVTAYILDQTGQAVTPGSEGELYVGGVQVARGYLNRPQLTREKFLPNPFAAQPGARMYRTGDWVRHRTDGEIDFIGRRDDQVQIRGRRVELGEVEHKLQTHPAVRQVCCRPIIEGDAVTGIVAHVACDEKPALAYELRVYLSRRVPHYMVPVEICFYDKLPQTSRGKVDRAALRDPKKPGRSPVETNLPEDSLERALAQLWYELLPLARTAAVDATFESLGGDSLHAIKLRLAVEELTGKRVPFSTFQLDPTLPGLCRLVRAAESGDSPAVLPLRKEGTRSPLFCLYGVGGDAGHYIELARVIGDDQPVYAVRSPIINDPKALPNSIEEAAKKAAHAIREVCPEGPVGLVGYSWGGLLAFEIARQWSEAGEAAPFIALVGTPAPERHVTKAQRIAHFIRRAPIWAFHRVWDSLTGRYPFPRPHRILTRLKKYVFHDPTADKAPMPEWASNPVYQHHIQLGRKYQPSLRAPLPVHLFREFRTFQQVAQPYRPDCNPVIYPDTSYQTDGGWSRWAGRPVNVHWIDTNHDDVIRAAGAKALARQLRDAMDSENPTGPRSENKTGL